MLGSATPSPDISHVEPPTSLGPSRTLDRTIPRTADLCQLVPALTPMSGISSTGTPSASAISFIGMTSTSTMTFTGVPSTSAWPSTSLPSISDFTAPAPVPLSTDAIRRSTSPLRFTRAPPKPTLTLLAFPNEILYNILEFLVPVHVENIRSHPFVALSSSCRLLYHLIETRCFRILNNAAEDPRVRKPILPPFRTARDNCFRNVLIRWLARRCRYCLMPSSRLAAMDESIRCYRPCDEKLHELYDIIDVGSAKEMWGLRDSELLVYLPHGPHGDMRRSLVRAYVEQKFGFDADLICAARSAYILARPVPMDENNSAQSREQAARTFWADMRQD
ncbi:hypothetical protein BZA05DRAFT_412988 [Tricharina praecox]|uniref:uncharacterized protein n=1 Tax=Tricharina praecox TaxID=43433 RepID=UPI002220562C|nr:uncharacterized protein BZA05DRAFT_412988 [Tricharina praecox]KAI5841633.1 hypothetical protein BZA05DRAFT_412988 [Tricharina praecox]